MLSAVRRAAWVILLMLGWATASASAELRVFEKVERYSVDATTRTTLMQQFRERGRNGFMGFTRWRVQWNSFCHVEVHITYTLPQHANLSAMPQDLFQKFERMAANLEAHERLHGAHGIKAGQEIRDANCTNGQAIIRKYARADKDLDRKTRHGRTQGVTLN